MRHPTTRPTKFSRFALTLATAAAVATSALAQVSPANLVFFGDRVVKESMASTAPIAQITSGRNFAAALRKDGTMAAWGADQVAQCDVPSGLLGIAQISAGDFHTLVLLTNGTVRAYGFNNYGQTTVPAGLTGVVQVAACSSFSVAVKSDGTVVEWGAGSGGGYLTPPAGLNNVAQVAGGYDQIVALKKDGSVVAWGSNGHGEITVPGNVVNAVQVAAAYQHSAALLANGTVVCWGDNSYGQSTPPSNLTGVKEIALGASHSLALTSAGAVVGWGSNTSGEINPPQLGTVTHISAAYSTSYALDSNGAMTGWGDSTFGEISTPNFANVKKVAAGQNHILLLASDGTVQAWGNNMEMESQLPNTPGIFFTDISAGAIHSALTASPLANKYMFGSNADGQITPAAAATSMDQWWAFGHTTYGHLKAGGVVAWGDNYYGQRGLPSTVDYLQITGGNLGALGLKPDGTLAAVGLAADNLNSVPAGATGITQIASGNTHNLALKNDGTVIAWGANITAIVVPPGLSSVIGIAAGDNHSAALLSDGSVTAWGDNTYGQILPPAGLTGMAQIAAGSNYTVCVPSMSLSVAPYQVNGGQSATGTVTLPSPAPAGGLTITLSTSNVVASVPAAVVVPAGATSATFAITTSNPAVTTQPIISAAFGSLVQSSLLTVAPSAFTMATSVGSVIGGSTLPASLTITLSKAAPASGAIVLVTSSDGSISLPLQTTFTSGQKVKQVTLTHSRVHANTAVTLTASYGGTTQTSSMTVNPFGVKAFSMTPATILSQGSTNALVYLNATPTTAVDVTITSSDNNAIGGPVTVTVPANSYSGTKAINAKSVSFSDAVTLTATVDGSSLTKVVTVNPAFTLTTSLASFVSGSTTPVTVTMKLAAPAPPGGLTINLTMSDPAISVGGPLLFLAGNTSVTVPLIHTQVSTQKTASIFATYGGTNAYAFVTLNPFLLTNFVVTPVPAIGGAATYATAFLNATPAAPVNVAIASSNPAVIPGPLTLAVPANATQGTVKVPTNQVSTPTTVTLVASLSGASSSVNVLVDPAIASISFAGSGVAGAGQINCTVHLVTAAPVGGLTVNLAGTNCQLFSSTWTIGAGQTSGTFPVYAGDPSVNTTATVTATYGTQSVSGTFLITPNRVLSFTVTPTTFAGNSSTVVTATATLQAPVSYDVFVSASSSVPSLASIPSIIKIPAGSASGSVTVSHSTVTRGAYVNLSASHAGVTKTVKVFVN